MGLIWQGGVWLDRAATPADTGEERGVFTTAGCEDGRALLWERHRDRLEGSLRALGHGRVPRLPEAEEVSELLHRLGVLESGRLRVVARLRNGEWSVEGEATAYDAPGAWARPLSLAVIRRPAVPRWAGHKSLAREAWDEAREQAVGRGCDDALLVGPGARVLETSVANVFVVRGERASTPSAPDLCLPGVMRGWLLGRLACLGVTAEERPVTLEELESADEVWVTNALVGVSRVARVGRRSWSSWPIRDRLADAGVPAPGWPASK